MVGQSLSTGNTSFIFSKLVFLFSLNAEQHYLMFRFPWKFTVPWTVHISLNTYHCVLPLSEHSQQKLHFFKPVFLFLWTPNNFIWYSEFLNSSQFSEHCLQSLNAGNSSFILFKPSLSFSLNGEQIYVMFTVFTVFGKSVNSGNTSFIFSKLVFLFPRTLNNFIWCS